MQDNKKEQLELLEAFYESLVPNHMRLFRAFIESEFEFESGYSSDHFYRTNQEHFEGASFPLPVIEVAGVCEVFINVDSLDFYARLPSGTDRLVFREPGILSASVIYLSNNLYLFRMEPDADDSDVIGFVKKLKMLGAYI